MRGWIQIFGFVDRASLYEYDAARFCLRCVGQNRRSALGTKFPQHILPTLPPVDIGAQIAGYLQAIALKNKNDT
jgi:hypothetical protein